MFVTLMYQSKTLSKRFLVKLDMQVEMEANKILPRLDFTT